MIARAALLALIIFPTFAIAQSTKPTTAPAKWATLEGGEIRYTEPAGWTAIALPNAKDMTATYKNPAGDAVVTINISPQQQPIPVTPSTSYALGQQILKAIKADLEKSKAELIEAPKLERDPRFMVRIHDKIRLNGITSDRLHVYRALGFNLIMVSVDVDNQTPENVKAAYAVGEELLDGTLLGKRDKKPAASRPARPKWAGVR
jgi:hypothetical protein